MDETQAKKAPGRRKTVSEEDKKIRQREYQKQYRLKNPDKFRNYAKQYREKRRLLKQEQDAKTTSEVDKELKEEAVKEKPKKKVAKKSLPVVEEKTSVKKASRQMNGAIRRQVPKKQSQNSILSLSERKELELLRKKEQEQKMKEEEQEEDEDENEEVEVQPQEQEDEEEDEQEGDEGDEEFEQMNAEDFDE